MWIRHTLSLGLTAAVALAGVARPAAGQVIGPSSSQGPYLLPSAPGVQTRSLLTVGDAVGGYRMVGNPDGLGAYDNGDGTITVLMNHELGGTQSTTRAHGTAGAFVSMWQINKATYAVTAGRDLISSVVGTGGAAPFNRFCSADLPAATAFFNPVTGLGTTERIFMNGEEAGAEGRAFGTVVPAGFAGGGTAYFLPHLGRFSHENSVASPTPQDRTVVIGTDDTAPAGQVYVYVGTKTNAGTPVDRAGLTNGSLYGIAVNGVTAENRTTGIPAGTRFGLFNFGDVSGITGATLQTRSAAGGVTEFLRPEDGAWDPTNPNRFYFATTDQFNGRSRLWRLTFDSIATPETGGTIEALLDGTEGQQMLDNLTVTRDGCSPGSGSTGRRPTP